MTPRVSIRALIVDDETHARARVRQLLQAEADFEIVGECAHGQQAVEGVKEHAPDVVFLDMQMPRLSGLEVCEALAAEAPRLPLVVFVTAYDQYALKAFEVHAIDYLLKPFDRERFQKTLSHIREQIQRVRSGALDQRLAALLSDVQPGFRKPDRLVLRDSGRVIFVKVDAITWIEADGNYVRVHAGGESHYLRETLTALEDKLPADKFLRVSRSAIVNLDRVKEIQPLFYGDACVILHDGTKVNLSRNFRDRLEKLLQGKA